VKILFFTTVFAPSVGGIERLADVLCREFVALGHEVRLLTTTPGEGLFPFPVVRKPSIVEFSRQLRWCDIHLQANVSLKNAWPRLIFARKFLVQHNNAYQRDDGTRSHVDHIKAFFARHTNGVANSHYTAQRTGVPQVVLNAYDDGTFRNQKAWYERKGELIFVGRLVSQKGCDTLLRALRHLQDDGCCPRLTIVGDGPERQALEMLTFNLGLSDDVRFVGTAQGPALAELLNDHRMIVVPSRYEEPFGIVALEGMACGCVPIVSEYGGLVDAIAGHGFTFPNGDDVALAQVLAKALRATDLARAQLNGVEAHLALCTARSVAEQYLQIFSEKCGQK
jgi:glycosyltransferase involved in cell wall biosynthesis